MIGAVETTLAIHANRSAGRDLRAERRRYVLTLHGRGMTYRQISNLLKEELAARGITGKRLGVSKDTVSRIINGTE